MNSYDDQYTNEPDLFGEPYLEFSTFVQQHLSGGTALDIGCGQGRDALMLARHGFQVVGVDGSAVGIAQMQKLARQESLQVEGIVADIFTWSPDRRFDVIVLDSILHFAKKERAQELALLDRLLNVLEPSGYLFVFIHRNDTKERHLQTWIAQQTTIILKTVADQYIDYTYQERQSGFQSSFQYRMMVLQKIG